MGCFDVRATPFEKIVFLRGCENHVSRSLQKNIIYIAKMVGKIGNFVCFLYFYDHFGPPVAMTRSSLTETMPPIRQQAGIRLPVAQQAYQAS
jgi:hypothetical protein